MGEEYSHSWKAMRSEVSVGAESQPHSQSYRSRSDRPGLDSTQGHLQSLFQASATSGVATAGNEGAFHTGTSAVCSLRASAPAKRRRPRPEAFSVSYGTSLDRYDGARSSHMGPTTYDLKTLMQLRMERPHTLGKIPGGPFGVVSRPTLRSSWLPPNVAPGSYDLRPSTTAFIPRAEAGRKLPGSVVGSASFLSSGRDKDMMPDAERFQTQQPLSNLDPTTYSIPTTFQEQKALRKLISQHEQTEKMRELSTQSFLASQQLVVQQHQHPHGTVDSGGGGGAGVGACGGRGSGPLAGSGASSVGFGSAGGGRGPSMRVGDTGGKGMPVERPSSSCHLGSSQGLWREQSQQISAVRESNRKKQRQRLLTTQNPALERRQEILAVRSLPMQVIH